MAINRIVNDIQKLNALYRVSENKSIYSDIEFLKLVDSQDEIHEILYNTVKDKDQESVKMTISHILDGFLYTSKSQYYAKLIDIFEEDMYIDFAMLISYCYMITDDSIIDNDERVVETVITTIYGLQKAVHNKELDETDAYIEDDLYEDNVFEQEEKAEVVHYKGMIDDFTGEMTEVDEEAATDESIVDDNSDEILELSNNPYRKSE